MSGETEERTTQMKQLGSYSRPVTALPALVALALVGLLAPSASASKGGDSLIGQASSVSGEAADGGLFNVPRDIAVNQSGAGGVAPGTIYVVDQNNHRVQRLSSSGAFQMTWGRDVVTTGAPNDLGTAVFEICDATHPTTPNAAADCKAGTTATPALGGFLNSPSGIAVDQDTGDVYVRDRSNNRVQQFTAAGAFVRAWGWDTVTNGSPSDPGSVATFQVCSAAADCKAGAPGAGFGQFGTPGSNHPTLAVSPADGNAATGSVVVADPGSGTNGNRRVQVFDLADLAVGSPPSDLDGEIVGTTGSGSEFGSNFPRQVAVDAGGVVYATDVTDVTVKRYDSSAQVFLDPIELNDGYPGGLVSGAAAPEGLAIDPSNGHLLVTTNPNTGTPDTVIYEYAHPDAAEPVPSDFHMRGSGNQTTNGLGVVHNGSQDRLYVSASGGVVGHRILVLDEDGAQPAPIATIAPPSDVDAHSAVLHGTVNPSGPTGFSTLYHFEYSKNGVDWTRVSDPVDGGDGGVAAAVDDAVGSLEAGTFYRVRLVAQRTFSAGSATSAEIAFLTDSVPPEVATGPVRHRTGTTAEFIGRINPNNLPTTYRFEYGTTTAYGFQAPIPAGSAGSGGIEQTIDEGVEGLQPDTQYHYRLVATNAQGTAAGADRTFTTRADALPPSGRAYEMVTPPDKTSRRAGELQDEPTALVNPGTPSPDGDSLLFRLRLGFLDAEAGTDFPHLVDTVLTRRTPTGWKGESTMNVISPVPATAALESLQAMSADLETQAWQHKAQLFESGSSYGTKVFGDSGGLGGSGWYEWLTDLTPDLIATNVSRDDDRALIDDEGERMVRWGQYRGLLGDDDPSAPGYPSPSNPDHPADALTQISGTSVYFQESPGSGAKELVHECTGSGAGATLIPSRDDNGTGIPTVNDDKIGAQACEEGSVTSFRGATLGAGGGGSDGVGIYSYGPTTRAMSTDGDRVFFMSPDPRDGPGTTRSACLVALVVEGVPVTASGPLTDCSPQLYVRQRGSDGQSTVRWISRSEVATDNPSGQQIGLMGSGAIYQGASADGRYVFFKTNAPLVADDPNGAGAATPGGVTTGTASNNSWDVYRYELPSDTDTDPAGGELTRISGGPTGTADPNTNSSDAGNGSPVRYVSDDGSRAYFVTGSPIGDPGAAWNQPPAGGTTVPGGTVSNAATRNLYLYDGNQSGDARWRFVAQIPYAAEGTGLTSLANCASAGSMAGYAEVFSIIGLEKPQRQPVNCVRGTPDGSKIVFETPGQLTEDDTDSASDIYLYDAETNELTRVSAPPLGTQPYGCEHSVTGVEVGACNADLGFASPPGSPTRPARQEAVGLASRSHDNLAVGPDGQLSIFFESRVPLVAEDVNGDRMDTYQWRAGKLTLISPGKTADDAWYSGNSADGRDAFFFTSQRIDPREIDASDFDVYDARVGGGFAPPVPRPEGCDSLADGCQTDGTGTPTEAAPQTAVPGGGNASPPERVSLEVGTPRRKALRRAARLGTLRVPVTTSSRGVIRLLARAPVTVDGRRRRSVVASRRVRVAKTGRRVIALRLKPIARRQLRGGRSLRLVLKVGQANARTQTVRMTLRRAGK